MIMNKERGNSLGASFFMATKKSGISDTFLIFFPHNYAKALSTLQSVICEKRSAFMALPYLAEDFSLWRGVLTIFIYYIIIICPGSVLRL